MLRKKQAKKSSPVKKIHKPIACRIMLKSTDKPRYLTEHTAYSKCGCSGY